MIEIIDCSTVYAGNQRDAAAHLLLLTRSIFFLFLKGFKNFGGESDRIGTDGGNLKVIVFVTSGRIGKIGSPQ